MITLPLARPAQRAEVVIEVFDDTATLDPHRAFDTASRHPVLNVYDGLLELDLEKRLAPLLAASLPVARELHNEWEVVIPIRDDVAFHDGSRMTVDDVVYSLRRGVVTADAISALWSDVLLGAPRQRIDEESAREMVRRITPVADGVRLLLPAPFAPLDALLVQWSLVAPRTWCAALGEWEGDPANVISFLRPQSTALDTRVNGTGPYTLERWDRERRELAFRSARRGDGPIGQPERIVLRSVDDRQQRERELLDGRCDFSVCQPESRERLGEHDGIVLEKLPEEWSVTPLGFITQRLDSRCAAVGSGQWGQDGLPPDAFTDIHLRRTLALCFDYRRYVAEVLDGEGLPHPIPFPAPALPNVPALIPHTDLARARAEFAKAWDGAPAREGCRFTIYTHTANISRERAAEFLADGLRQVSDRVVVEIVPVDINTLVQLLYSSAAPVAWAGWATDFLHPYAFASTLLDPRAPLPAALGITDPALQDLVRRARVAVGTDEAAIYRQLAERAAEQALFVAPPGKVSYMTYSDRWQGVRLRHHVPNVLDFTTFRPRQTVENGG